VAGYSEHGNIPSGSVKGGEFFRLGERLPASQDGLCSMELILIFELRGPAEESYENGALNCREVVLNT
jgi:hypothetical protein